MGHITYKVFARRPQYSNEMTCGTFNDQITLNNNHSSHQEESNYILCLLEFISPFMNCEIYII